MGYVLRPNEQQILQGNKFIFSRLDDLLCYRVAASFMNYLDYECSECFVLVQLVLLKRLVEYF